MKSQDYIHKFMREVYNFFKRYDSTEPITLQDLTCVYVYDEGFPDDNIHEWIDEDGETPIHYAVRFWETSSLGILLEESDENGNRFNILQRNKQGKTAMRLAFEYGNIAAVDYLACYYPAWFQKKLRNAIKSFARRTATI